MKIIKSEEFRELGKKCDEMLHSFGDRPDDRQKEFCSLKKIRAETLTRVEDLTDARVNVANDNDPRIGGFYDPDEKTINIAETALDDLEFAKQIVHHEKGHERHDRQGIKEISLRKNLKSDEFETINNSMKEHGFDLKNINLLEGFVEYGKSKEHGVNNRCAYNKKEVPAAKLLEEICQKEMGMSLLEAFKDGDMALFYELAGSLSGILTVRESLGIAA